MPKLNGNGEVRVAGGVILRIHEGELQVLLVYRKHFNDWSPPKGKVKRSEEDAAAALREVVEETGLRCELLAELGAVRYRDNQGRAKAARYWAMAVNGGRFEPNSEVDACRWFALSEAAAQATRSGDREFLARLAETLQVRSAGDQLVIYKSSYITVLES
jgi:8-oxo-dGTP diphosphatase